MLDSARIFSREEEGCRLLDGSLVIGGRLEDGAGPEEAMMLPWSRDYNGLASRRWFSNSLSKEREKSC